MAFYKTASPIGRALLKFFFSTLVCIFTFATIYTLMFNSKGDSKLSPQLIAVLFNLVILTLLAISASTLKKVLGNKHAELSRKVFFSTLSILIGALCVLGLYLQLAYFYKTHQNQTAGIEKSDIPTAFRMEEGEYSGGTVSLISESDPRHIKLTEVLLDNSSVWINTKATTPKLRSYKAGAFTVDCFQNLIEVNFLRRTGEGEWEQIELSRIIPSGTCP